MNDIIDIVIVVIFLSVVVSLFVIAIVLACKGSRNRKLFISRLDEHDKNVILEYLHITAFTKL